MPRVCDLTPKFRIASTHEKVRKKEVETLFWYIKASFILLFINYEYFCCFQGTSVMLLLDTGVRQKRKSVRWKYKILLFVQKSMCTEQMKLNKAGEIPCRSIYIWVVFFAITFGLKNTIYLINCRLWQKIDLVTWTKFASFEYKWNWKACHALMHNCQEQFFTRLKRVKTKVSKNCTSSSLIWIEFHGFTVLLREDDMLLTREYIRARFLKNHCAY